MAPEQRVNHIKPESEPPHDVRCPHCAVIILKKERVDPRADRQGAPEFCPRCGQRTDVLPG